MKNAIATLALTFTTLLPGCGYLDFTSGGLVPMNNTSQAIMDQSDFTIIATNLRGQASCSYLFGIPLSKPDIFSEAMNQMVESARLKDNGSRVLVNFAGDNNALSILGLFVVKTVTLRCDLAQFDK